MKWPCPTITLMIILNITIESSSATDGNRDRDPHQSNGLSPQGPVEEQKEGEDEQGSLDHEGLVHALRQCACSNGSSPNPDGPRLNEHAIKPDPLNVAENGA